MNKIILVIFALILLGGGFFLFNSNMQKQPSNVAPTVVPTGMEKSPTEESDAMEKTENSTVTLTNTGFTPATITVKAGDKVVWLNQSGGTATVHSAMHPTHLVYPKLNLGNFDVGGELSLVFDEVGTYKYHDHLNPTRFGTVVVE